MEPELTCTFYEPWNKHGVNIKECKEYDDEKCFCREPLSEHDGSKCPWWGLPGYDVEPRTLKEEKS